MAGYTFDSYKVALQTLAVSQAPDVPFDNILPSTIDYAELRIYRELNLVATITEDYDTDTVIGERSVQLAPSLVTLTNINVLTPAGSTRATGVRAPLVPVSRDVLDTLWPSPAITATPEMFAIVNQSDDDGWKIILGPSPDAAYTLETVGTFRPDALSATNTTTFISVHLPDLFLAASMVMIAMYQRNFAGAGNDPQMGATWELQFQALKASADTEELRKRWAGASWTSQPVSPAAQPQRG